MKHVVYCIVVWLFLNSIFECHGVVYADEGDAPLTESSTDQQDNAMAAVDPENSLASNENSLEDEKAKFFLKAFGTEVPTVFHPHEMEVLLNQNFSTIMIVDINPYTYELQFQSSELMPFLEECLLYEQLTLRFGNALPDILTEEFLRSQEFEFELNMKHQRVSLTSPMNLRKRMDVSLSSRRSVISIQQKQSIAPWSGYVNMSHGLTAARDYRMYMGQYDVNVNAKDWVVQSEIRYNGAQPQPLSWSSGRVVKDIPRHKVRVMLGDSASPNLAIALERPPMASGFQQTLFGVRVNQLRRFLSSPDQQNTFRQAVTISEDARIEVFINGRSVFSQIVLPGKYELKDFPFQMGRNDVLIQVFGYDGLLEEIETEFFYNPSLLPKGEKRYQVASGYPYEMGTTTPQIDSSNLTNVAYLRYGISNQVGATGYIQTVQNRALVGMMGEYAFKSNIISMEAVRSRNLQDQSGQALRVQAYSSNTKFFGRQFSFLPTFYTVNIQLMSEGFDPTLMGISTNKVVRSIAPSMAWQVSPACQVQLSGMTNKRLNERPTRSFKLRTFYRAQQWNLNASIEHASGLEENELTLFTSATWRPKGQPRNRYSHRYNTDTKQHSVMASMRPEETPNLNYQWNTNYVDLRNTSHIGTVQYQSLAHNITTQVSRMGNVGNRTHEVAVDYFGPRALADISHTRYQGRGGVTSLQVNNALAVVGQHWGISRPISNSFAILYPNNEAMNDSKINFTSGSVLDRYSAAVVPNVGNYRDFEVEIDTADVPLGLDLGAQKYRLYGSLNSGQAIPVGKPGGVLMARAILNKPDGTPLDLNVGTFVSSKYPDLQVQFFTNQSGGLFVMGLTAGVYTIEILGDAYAPLTVKVPKSKDALVDLGTLTLSPSTTSE